VLYKKAACSCHDVVKEHAKSKNGNHDSDDEVQANFELALHVVQGKWVKLSLTYVLQARTCKTSIELCFLM
jgi:hypothetical protein